MDISGNQISKNGNLSLNFVRLSDIDIKNSISQILDILQNDLWNEGLQNTTAHISIKTNIHYLLAKIFRKPK